MKANPLAHRIRIGLLCIALVTVPLLAKGIFNSSSDPVSLEQLNVQPIPVPMPPAPVARNEPAALATAAPPWAKIVPVPVPTPLAQTSTSSVQRSQSEAAASIKIPLEGRLAVIVLPVILIFFTVIKSYRLLRFHSLHQECA